MRCVICEQAYIDDKDDMLQLTSMLSITMTLFCGILLKTNTQDEDEYGAALLSVLLMGLNIGVVLMFAIQVVL